MSKQMDILLKIKGMVDKTLPTSLRKIADEAKNLKVQKDKLEKQKKLIENETKLKKELQGQIKAIQANRNTLKSLELAKKSGATLTKQEEERYRKLTAERKKLDKQIKDNYNSYKQYRMEVQKLKITYDGVQKEINQTINAMKKLTAQEKITKFSQKVGAKVSSIKDSVVQKVKTAAVIGTGMAIGGILTSSKDYIEFDKQMKKVQAISGATVEEFKLLQAEAERLGNTTKFTSSEAAAGMEKFALAGFKPTQIIEILSSVLDLATASGEDFIMVSDIISDQLENFKLTTNDTNFMADVLANTMSRTNTNIYQLGEALAQVGPAAKNLNIDIGMTSAAIGFMGDTAIKSGKAGRYLNEALSRMNDNTVVKKLNAYGIRTKDTKGNALALVDILKQVDKVTSKMGSGDKLGFLNEMFGKNGSKAITTLLTAKKEIEGITYTGVEALEKFAEQNLNSQGKAKEMVDTMMSGAGGSWDLFTSAIDSLKLTIGKMFFDSGGLDWLKTITKYINELVNVLKGQFTDDEVNIFMQNLVKTTKDLWEAFKEIGKALFSVAKFINMIGVDNILLFITVFNITSKVVTFVGAIQKAITTIKAAGGIIAALKTGIGALGGPITLIVAAIAVLGYVIYKNWDKIKIFFIELWQKLKNIGKMVYDILSIVFKDLYKLIKWYINLVISFWEKVYEAVKDVYIGIWEAIKFVMESIVNGIKIYIKIIVAIWESIFSVVKAIFSNIWDLLTGKTSSISEMFLKMWRDITGSFKNIWDGVKNYISDIINNMLEKISGFKENFKNKVLEIAGSIPGLSFFVKTKKEVDGSHKAGLNYVPYDGYIAELHKGERVLTANENGNIYDNLLNVLNEKKKTTTQNINKAHGGITIHFSPKFEGVNGEVADKVIESMQKEIEKLKESLIRVLEKGETDARISL